ncbi:cryptochrome/photolyase family protein [Parasphingorhabdus halotolerans]|uniref:Deoxyribodipyrimidine photo-lyase n=1 Tax=Parasphingorhabdus halotolerans TaxID=2725558 RepID=A0A6H2DHT0_9SPHN|nr:deoxyribodipyrimidine photo-lyase [Parasphingorhabdus halotolerans]QJB67940.1 deoxyribodipyrimidine photo-lyase [Parasphingorhabdus halotolerans]
MTKPNIIWFRRDLRLSDQAAVIAAASEGPVIPVYILDDETPKHRKMGGASRWWLHHSLASLAQRLEEKGSRLILRSGDSAEILANIARQTGAIKIHALRHYEPWWLNAESHLQGALDDECELVLHDGNYLQPAGAITTGSGDPYKIYTPFWKALRETMPPPEPQPVPQQINAPNSWPDGDDLNDWELLPTKPNWATGFAENWKPGEDGARVNLDAFVDIAKQYDEGRNLPSEQLVSRLSPHLHFGEISPNHIWHRVTGKDPAAFKSVETYLKELVWRDYAQNVIYQCPQYGGESYREKMRDLPWRDLNDTDVQADFEAWSQGKTGYPIVDAGMRELWATGWMHNRVRMIASSFLIKHLLIDWREGEKWFWDTLVDADYGSNTVNWQWGAGTGVDSNMFVRIMAPLTQSEKFNAGDYIRKWVPELVNLDDPYIHDPEEHGCRPNSYPTKIIAHKKGRQRALDAYAKVK